MQYRTTEMLNESDTHETQTEKKIRTRRTKDVTWRRRLPEIAVSAHYLLREGLGPDKGALILGSSPNSISCRTQSLQKLHPRPLAGLRVEESDRRGNCGSGTRGQADERLLAPHGVCSPRIPR